MGRACSTYGEKKNIYGGGRLGHRCKDNIKMDLRYIYVMRGCKLDSSGSGQVVGSCDYRNKLPGSKIAGHL
jgi:hypothetical protein